MHCKFTCVLKEHNTHILTQTYLCCVHCALLLETPCAEVLLPLQMFCQNTPCHAETFLLRRKKERKISACSEEEKCG